MFRPALLARTLLCPRRSSYNLARNVDARAGPIPPEPILDRLDEGAGPQLSTIILLSHPRLPMLRLAVQPRLRRDVSRTRDPGIDDEAAKRDKGPGVGPLPAELGARGRHSASWANDLLSVHLMVVPPPRRLVLGRLSVEGGIFVRHA